MLENHLFELNLKQQLNVGIRCIYYIDDSLNMEQDFDKCKDNTNIMVQKLDDLGYRINRKKSVLSKHLITTFFCCNLE
jgi:hypothetical protein